MTEFTSILHISDLHRSSGEETSNAALLSSLVNDKNNYTFRETKKIKPPDLIVVSGDIIRGSTHPTDSEEEVIEQYKEANDFLTSLATHFLHGDKQKIVLIPGNHDIDWKYSRESMIKIDTNEIFDDSNKVKSQYLTESVNQRSNTRWNWRDLSFYKITNVDTYNKRLKAFSEFYHQFYDGEKTYSLDPKNQYEIFDYPNFNITIVAYNSCYCNDHLRFAGEIHPDCIASSNLELAKYNKRGRLIIATWHHNTKGLPYEANYMDSRRLKNFIDSGISLGFHGHQHKTEIIHEFNDVIEQKNIVVFSAGTLCGGSRELPTGNNRQYNLIEINWENSVDHIEVTLHTREKTETSSLDNPIWKPGRIDSNLVSFHTIKINKPKVQEIGSALLEIESLMKSFNYELATEQLLKLSLEDDFVRKFLVECIIQTENYELALVVFSEPTTELESITALNASIELNKKTEMKDLAIIAKTLYPSNPTIKVLVNQVEAITNE